MPYAANGRISTDAFDGAVEITPEEDAANTPDPAEALAAAEAAMEAMGLGA